jgi:hypothetical protein
MEPTTFFPGSQRRVTLGSPTRQSSNGRIVFAVAMPLTAESFTGMPSWISDGYEAVSTTLREACPEIEQVADITLAFSDDKPAGELFSPPSAKIAAAELRGFKILRAGDSEDLEIELHFKAFAPYTREFWAWIGEMCGKEVWMGFPLSLSGTLAVPPKSGTLPLTGNADAPQGESGPAPGIPDEPPTLAESIGDAPTPEGEKVPKGKRSK